MAQGVRLQMRETRGAISEPPRDQDYHPKGKVKHRKAASHPSILRNHIVLKNIISFLYLTYEDP